MGAIVECGGRCLHVSRLDGENTWTVDAAIRLEDGFPLFVNGFGARYLRTSRIADPQIIAVLDEMSAA
jgi:hypothetical protein